MSENIKKDLTVSQVDRQNILNNPYALQEIEKATRIKGIPFEGKTVVLKEQVSGFFEVTLRTIENYLGKYSEELAQNGYEVLKGNRLKNLKLSISESDVPETDFGNITKAPQLSVFDFRAFLNLAMLITESERARLLRQMILDIVIDIINQKTGGGTRYINQRDEDFLLSAFQEENYRKEFTDALKNYVDMGNFKYPLYTDKIYVSIFKEKAKEYRKILRLHDKDKVRDQGFRKAIVTLYEHRCALCGIRMLTPEGHTVVEAAHVVPWSESYDDRPTNGMSLCRLCHWSFDEGLMSVGEKYEVLVSKYVNKERNFPGHMLTLSDRSIFKPEEGKFWPGMDTLEWHRVKVFCD